MPYDVHFVSRDENPVGWTLWRIATVAQDAQEYADEAGILSTGLKSIDHTSGTVNPLGAMLHERKKHDVPIEDAADATASVRAQVEGMVEQAKALAAGKDPHDEAVLAQLTAILTDVEKLAGSTRAADDSVFKADDSRADTIL